MNLNLSFKEFTKLLNNTIFVYFSMHQHLYISNSLYDKTKSIQLANTSLCLSEYACRETDRQTDQD